MRPSALPHRYPFLLIDRVLAVQTGRSAVALKNVTRNDPFLDAGGALPPILLVEIMAQAAGLAVVSPASGLHALLGKIDRFRCRPPIGPGDQLLVVARVVRRFGANVIVRASVSVAGRRRAAAELVLHFLPRPGDLDETS